MIYLDANVLITAFELAGPTADDIWHMLKLIDEHAVITMTSAITLAEVLVKPIETGNRALQRLYETLLSNDGVFHVIAVDQRVLVRSAHLRANDRSLKLLDAVHLASAMEAGTKIFVTQDRRIRSQQDLAVYQPRDIDAALLAGLT